MAFSDIVKQWFEVNDYPTQDQFSQTFDGLRWKDEPLSIADISGLADILNAIFTLPERRESVGGEIEYIIPLGYRLENVIVLPSVDCYPYLSNEGGAAGDIVALDSGTLTTAADGADWEVRVFAITVQKVVILSNLPAGSVAYFIKRKIY